MTGSVRYPPSNHGSHEVPERHSTYHFTNKLAREHAKTSVHHAWKRAKRKGVLCEEESQNVIESSNNTKSSRDASIDADSKCALPPLVSPEDIFLHLPFQ